MPNSLKLTQKLGTQVKGARKVKNSRMSKVSRVREFRKFLEFKNPVSKVQRVRFWRIRRVPKVRFWRFLRIQRVQRVQGIQRVQGVRKVSFNWIFMSRKLLKKLWVFSWSLTKSLNFQNLKIYYKHIMNEKIAGSFNKKKICSTFQKNDKNAYFFGIFFGIAVKKFRNFCWIK